MKADCLVHYSYQKSNEQLMLLDIQGSNYSLFDPEIGTKDLLVNDEVLFRAGNFLYAAMENIPSYSKFELSFLYIQFHM